MDAMTIFFVLCRLLVFYSLKHALEKTSGKKFWLRVHIAPTHYFREDEFGALFSTIFTTFSDRKVKRDVFHNTFTTMLATWNPKTRGVIDGIRFNVAVDEAQVLAYQFDSYFESSSRKDERRSILSQISKSIFSVVLKLHFAH